MSHFRLTQPVSSTRLLDDAGSETLWFREIEVQEVSAARGVEMGKKIPEGRSQRGCYGKLGYVRLEKRPAGDP